MNINEKRDLVESVTGVRPSKIRVERYLTEYEVEAMGFLRDTETMIEIKFIGKVKPDWQTKPVNTYQVTLKNKNYTYTFNFYASLHDTYGPTDKRNWDYRAEAKHKQTQANKFRVYDVIACLDVDCSEDFVDWCDIYGYDSDSRSAHKTYEAIREETRALKKLWRTEEQRERLNNIN